MKFCLICAVGVLAMTGTVIVADVVDVTPAETYSSVLQTSGWSPAQKAYSLNNTSYDWIYWQASGGDRTVCEPRAGWIAPGRSTGVTIRPAAAMSTAQPGTYSEQVRLDFDPRLVGDVTGDGSVNIMDLLLLSGAWNSQATDATYDPSCDFNGDGSVDLMDLLGLAGNWNRTFGGTMI